MFCKHCGKEIDENALFCNYCGGKQKDDIENEEMIPKKENVTKKKNKTIAVLLALFLGIFGAVSFYKEKPGEGVTILIINLVLLALSFLYIPIFIVFLFWLINLIMTLNDKELYDAQKDENPNSGLGIIIFLALLALSIIILHATFFS